MVPSPAGRPICCASWVPNEFVQDDFVHEHSLVLEGEDGLVVFNSCSHGGIVNIVQGVQEALNRQVTTVVGGLHMFSTSTLSGLNCPPEYPGQVARALKEQGYGGYTPATVPVYRPLCSGRNWGMLSSP